VEVTAPPGLAKDGLTSELNGCDVTSAFVDEGHGKVPGLLTGLNVDVLAPVSA